MENDVKGSGLGLI